MNIKCDSEPVYGDKDKYIKTKIKSYGDKVKFSREKSAKRKNTIWVLVIDSVRVCYQKKQKALFSKTFGRVKIYNKKNKIDNLINDDLD